MAKTQKCKTCKKNYQLRPHEAAKRNRYCSYQCYKSAVQTVSSLKKLAWNAFAKYIRERDKYTCYTCGKVASGNGMHAGHFISRRHNSTLFHERNVHAQCASCNMFMNGQPHLYVERMIRDYGQDFVLELIALSKEVKKFTKQELQEIYEKYKKLI